MQLANWKGPPAYYTDDIKTYLGAERWEKFVRWFDGQTGGITPDGRFVIYKYDFERFIANKEVLD